MVDRVRPLKYEDPSSGGDEVDFDPTSADPNEDFVDVRGVNIQNDTSDDVAVQVSRDASNNMIFKDGPNPSPSTLTDLLEQSGAGGDEVERLLLLTTGGVIYNMAGAILLKEDH